MFEQYSGGGNPFRKKRRYGFGDDDGSTPLSSSEYNALKGAYGDTPLDEIPQKRDFTLFAPVVSPKGEIPNDGDGFFNNPQTIANTKARFANTPTPASPVDDPPPSVDPALLQTVSFLPQVPQIQKRPPETDQTGGGGGTSFAPVIRNEVQTTPDRRSRIVPGAPVVQAEPLDTQTPAPTVPGPPVVVTPRDRVTQAEQKLDSIRNREYGFKKYRQGDQLEDGQYVDKKGFIRGADGKRVPGNDRDKTHNGWDVLRSIGLGALGGLRAGGLGGAIGGAGVGLVGGIVDRDFDNKLQDQMFGIPKAQSQLEDARQAEGYDQQRRTRDAQIDIALQRPETERRKLDQKDAELDIRRSRQKFQNINDAQKTVLSAIFRRGYYREGVNADEDKQLAALGIVLPDFDSRKRDVKEQAGKFYQKNPDTNLWEETNMPVDESEVPIDFEIGGQKMKLRPRDIAGIEAAKERQTSQQAFTADQNERDRQHQLKVKEIEQNFRREQQAIEQAQRDAQNAQNAEQKIEAEKRQEASRKRVAEYQKQLEKELYDYKNPKE